MHAPRVLIVDLNNFAMYPTVSVGYLAALCRRAGMVASVFSPLSVGVKGIVRERPADRWSLIAANLNFRATTSKSRTMREMRSWIATSLRAPLSRHHRRVARAFEVCVRDERPDVVLISTYLMFRPLVVELCRIAAAARVPVLVGGPYFAQPEVIEEWLDIEGMTALVTGEIELQLPQVIEAIRGGGEPPAIPGLSLLGPGGEPMISIAPPLRDLDPLPFPDYGDFPWDRYPRRIVPVITGRGCAWGACTFCSDVTSTAGRTFRSRSPALVLEEIRHHHETLGTKEFVFTDLKLNSNLDMWRAILANMQTAAPGSRWIASVHVNARGDDGLSADELRAAAHAGCVRLTTGLESGSQRLLDEMHKGTAIDGVSRYLRTASEAGISTRCTMIAGYPGEEAEDVQLSASFVREHERAIERIKVCQFSLITGTGIDKMRRAGRPERVALSIKGARPRALLAQIDHYVSQTSERSYRRAMARFLRAVHEVNRRPLRERAREFEGVM